jgi:hypothetical protein
MGKCSAVIVRAVVMVVVTAAAVAQNIMDDRNCMEM